MQQRIKNCIIVASILFLLSSSVFSGAQLTRQSTQLGKLNLNQIESNTYSSLDLENIQCYNPIFDQCEMNNYQTNITYFLDFLQTDNDEYVICGYGGTTSYMKSFLLKTDAFGNEIWNVTFDSIERSIFYSLDHTNDGGYIVTGYVNNETGDSIDILLLKTDEHGNKEWIQTYNFGKYSRAYSVISSENDEYIIVGFIGENTMQADYVILKTNNFGEIIWLKIIEAENPYTYYVNIIGLENGGYLVGGTKKIDDIDQFFLIKVDESGNEMWEETYRLLNFTAGYDFLETSDGQIIVVGNTYNDNQSVRYHMFIMKTDDFGQEIWIKTFLDSAAFSVEETEDGKLIVCGYAVNEEDPIPFLKKCDKNGNEEWKKEYDDFSSHIFWNLLQTRDKGYIICGFRQSHNIQSYYMIGSLIKTDEDGLIEWNKTYDFSDVDHSFVTFYGWDVSKSVYSIQIKSCNHRISMSSGKDPLKYYETHAIGTCPGTYNYFIEWFGKEGSNNISGVFTVQADEHKRILNNLSFCDDVPNIDVIKPINGIYIFNKKILPFFIPIIIGQINISAEVFDNSSEIDRVEFYINDNYISTDYVPPYSLLLDLNKFGKSEIEIKAFDTWDYNSTKEFTVWSI